ncbi:MAG: cell division protein ZapA [Candidatus Fermentibacteria bacterium]|nr:cell division protein ZapA [Candidatus Fermentibacteria bacterium]
MPDRPETTRVNIYGREYSIRGEGDPAYIAEIAHFLDMRMRQMTENIAMTSTAKVAILASLNITDELFTKTRQLEEMEDGHQMFLSSLADKINDVLSPEENSSESSVSPLQEQIRTASTDPQSIFQKSTPGSSKDQP